MHDWGFDRGYVDHQLDILASRADDTRIKALFGELSAFLAANQDCNAAAMMAELMGFLRELIAADGVIDEREEMAI